MKKLLSLLTFSFLALALAMPSSVFAATAHTWGERQPTDNGTANWNAIATDDTGTNLIAAASGGSGEYYISGDSGATWTNVPGFPSTGGVNSSTYVASDADGSNLIVGAFNRLLYTSNDGGDTWTERQPAGGQQPGDWRVASDDDGSTLFVSYGGFDMYVSHDSGVTWEPSVGPAGGGSAIAVDADGSNLVAGEFGGNLHVSTDGGDSWQPTSLTGNFWTVASDDDGSNIIVTNSTGLFISDDGGDTWTERQPGGGPLASASVSSDADGSHLTAGGYTSDDGGLTWVVEPIGASSLITVDDDGTHLFAFTNAGRLYTSPDATGPTIASFTPVDDEIEVAVDATFDVVFNEDIATSTGDITLHLVSDDSLVETIDVAGPKVTLSDTDTLTIDPTTTLELDTEYYFLADAGVVEDALGNSFAGISDPTTWSFTSDTPPSISSLAPEDGGTDVALSVLSNGAVYIYFNQNIAAGTGNITLKKVSDDSTVVALDVNDPESYVYVDGTSANLYFPITLDYATDYYFIIDAGAIEDANGNAFVGVSESTTWNFTTRATPIAPTFDFERVSVSDEGVEGDAASYNPHVSGDGRYVAFSSEATNLVPDDTNDCEDVFVYDRDTNIIERVSVSDEGDQGNDCSYMPRLSSNGQYVVFESDATNLVADDTNGQTDVFVYDRDTDTIERVSVNDATEETDGGSSTPDISSDGRFITYSSVATNLVPDDTNGYRDIFVYDRDTDTVERVSVNDEGEETIGGEDGAASTNPSISTDGRFIAFDSFATNLVADDTNDMRDVFVYDRDINTVERLSVNSSEEEADNPSGSAALSSDGRYIVFASSATNLTSDEVNGDGAVFLRDTTLGTTVLIGEQYIEADTYATGPDISTDGRYIVYSAYDAIEGNRHIYRYDTDTSIEFLVTEEVGDIDQTTDARVPSVSSNGRVVAFQSSNTDLVDDDTNDVDDIFVWEEAIDEEETPPTDDEDNTGNSGSHRRSGGGGSSLPPKINLSLLELLRSLIQQFIDAGGTPTPTMLVFLNGPTTTGGYTRDLDLNSEGSDVTALQLFLITQSKGPQAQALAVVGAAGFFGPLTQAALAEYQASVGITPASGYFGPITRAYLIAIGAWW